MNSPPEKKIFRKHTAQERKEEKRRYRARKKQLKRVAKLLAAKGADLKEDRKDGLLDHVGNQAIPVASGLSRGLKLVELAKQQKGMTLNENAMSNQDKTVPRVRKEDLTYQNCVGSGSFGDCYKGFYRDNIPVVIKIFKKSVVEEVLHEATALQEIQTIEHHPSLPLLIGVCLKSKPYKMITQFHGGNDNEAYTISSAVENNVVNNVDQWLSVLSKLSKALGFVHCRGWIHNDLKENNVVLHLSKDTWIPVIIDFGKSERISKAKPSRKKYQDKHYYWIAPEVLSGGVRRSPSTDIFSLGKILRFVSKKVNLHHRFSELKDLYLSCCDVPALRPKSAQAVAAKLEAMK